MQTKFKTAYVHPKTKGLSFLDEDGKTQPSKTKQCFKAECNINNIVKKYDGGQGLLTHVNQAIAQYGDFTKVNEFQESLNLVNKSNENFAKIPSDIRRRFGNDAGLFLEFATNPENNEEMVKLGLAVKPKPTPKEEPIKVEVISTQPITENPTK